MAGRLIRRTMLLLVGLGTAGLTGTALARSPAPQGADRPAVAAVVTTKPASPEPDAAEVSGLALQAIALRATIAGERARLDSFLEAKAQLTGTLDKLREEIATLQAMRDTLARDASDPRCAAATGVVPVLAPLATPARIPADRTETAPSPHIFLHHRAGSTAGRRAAELIAAEARRAGLSVTTIEAEDAVPKIRTIRPAAAEDAALAADLAARFHQRWGHPWRVEDPPKVPQAGERDLEIWLPH